MPRSVPRWLRYSLLALACSGLWGLVSALASKSMSPYLVQVVSTAGLVPVALVMAFSPHVRWRGGRWPGVAFASACGLVGGGGNLAMYAALKDGAASLVVPLTGMFPLVTLALARGLLRERINRVQALGVGLAMAAIVLFGLTPGETVAWGWDLVLAPWLALSLLALVLFGSACFMQKLATRYVSDELATICFTLASIPLAALIALLVPLDWSFTWRQAVPAVLAGTFMLLATFALFAALRGGQAAVVSSLTALSPVLTVLLAVPVLDERLDAVKVAAIALALAAGAALSAESASPAAGEAPAWPKDTAGVRCFPESERS